MARPRSPFQSDPNELFQLEKMLTAALRQSQQEGKVPSLTPEQEREVIQNLSKTLTNVKNIAGKKEFNELLKPENMDVLLVLHSKAAKDPLFKHLVEKTDIIGCLITPKKDWTPEQRQAFTQLKLALMQEYKKVFGPDSTKPADLILSMEEALRDEKNTSRPFMETPLCKPLINDLFIDKKAKFASSLEETLLAQFGVTNLSQTGRVIRSVDKVAVIGQVVFRPEGDVLESAQEKSEEAVAEQTKQAKHELEQEQQPTPDVSETIEAAADAVMDILSSEESATQEEEEENEEEKQATYRSPTPFSTKPR